MKMSRWLLFVALGIETVLTAITVLVLATAKSLGALSILLLQWPAIWLLHWFDNGNASFPITGCILIFGTQTGLIWLGLCCLRVLWPKSPGWQVSGRPIVVYGHDEAEK